MTNTRKPDVVFRPVEKIFAKIEADEKIYAKFPGQGELLSRALHGYRPHKFGYTPAPDLAMFTRHEPVAKPTRDYEALRRAAFEPGSTPEKPIPKRPVGYWQDAPRGEPFREEKILAMPEPKMTLGMLKPYLEHAAKLAEKALGMPVPQCDDGGWPKWERNGEMLLRFDSSHAFVEFRAGGKSKSVVLVKGEEAGYGEDDDFEKITEAEAVPLLEHLGHAKAAEALRGKVEGEFEPLSVPWRVGDVVYNENDQVCFRVKDTEGETLRPMIDWEKKADFAFSTNNGRHFYSQGSAEKEGWRIKRRAPAKVEARAYLESKWWYRVRIGERVWFKRHPEHETECYRDGWHEQHFGGFMEPVNADECIKNRGGTELHDPATVARLVEECRAAGLR